MPRNACAKSFLAFVEYTERLIGTAVIDDEDFHQVGWIILRGNGVQAIFQGLFAIFHRNDNGYMGKIAQRGWSFPVFKMEKDVTDQSEQRGNAIHQHGYQYPYPPKNGELNDEVSHPPAGLERIFLRISGRELAVTRNQ